MILYYYFKFLQAHSNSIALFCVEKKQFKRGSKNIFIQIQISFRFGTANSLTTFLTAKKSRPTPSELKTLDKH